jgi:hypothetical protein
MKKTSGNYVRITILKIKTNDQILSSFRLKLQFNNQINETEKLQGKEIDLGKVL